LFTDFEDFEVVFRSGNGLATLYCGL